MRSVADVVAVVHARAVVAVRAFARSRRPAAKTAAALGVVALVAVGLGLAPLVGGASNARPPLLRVTTTIPRRARAAARPLVLTLGGPVYCGQVVQLARRLHASLVCTDYGRNGERSAQSRSRRVEDWGDPRYLAAVARLPRELEAENVKISELILVGASYAGYAAAELAATHPELHPRALIIVDGFLDLTDRFRALLPGQPTRAEMIRVLGGTPGTRSNVYRRRSPSDHLAGLADEVRHGMVLLDVWSVGARAAREFNGAMCSTRSNAFWLRRLAGMLHRPLAAYVTRLPHAQALWGWWPQLLRIAGLAGAKGRFPGARVVLRPGRPIPAASYCRLGAASPLS